LQGLLFVHGPGFLIEVARQLHLVVGIWRTVDLKAFADQTDQWETDGLEATAKGQPAWEGPGLHLNLAWNSNFSVQFLLVNGLV